CSSTFRRCGSPAGRCACAWPPKPTTVPRWNAGRLRRANPARSQAASPASSPATPSPATSSRAPASRRAAEMAANATVFRAELQVSDMDRNYYATHALTLARHPSETDERLMVRLLAFALHADERLEFARGAASDDEPDLWRKSLGGEI